MQLVAECEKEGNEITLLCETHLNGELELKLGKHTLFSMGTPEGATRLSGVGFLVSPQIRQRCIFTGYSD